MFLDDESNDKLIFGLTIDFGSICSFIGCIGIIIYAFFSKVFLGENKIWYNFILYISICDMVGCINFLLRRFMKDDVNSCRIQGLIINFFFLSSVFWTSVIAFSIYWVGILNKKIQSLERFKYIFHVIVWGLSLLLTGSLYFIEKILYIPKNKFILGSENKSDVKYWCWVNAEYGIYGIYFFYIPIWIAFLFNAYIYITFDIKKKKHDMSDILDKYPIIKRTRYFLFSLFIIWMFGSLNRIHDLIYDESFYVLQLFHTTFIPLQGFINSVTYFWCEIFVRLMDLRNEFYKREKQNIENNDNNHNHNHNHNHNINNYRNNNNDSIDVNILPEEDNEYLRPPLKNKDFDNFYVLESQLVHTYSKKNDKGKEKYINTLSPITESQITYDSKTPILGKGNH
ncbi:hypothetical protein BCR32DRAFT_289821 [Anaeromyces robustus]|uniref:G-protein coupled receptors family 2 profile 2 domain-containing protein n=1 Tax=Anaeromyces robustus TaxID=1754192 RepID=A0A1Y1XLX9_9FUNG|nr:hypothetical protein BCR32DRAFT_289821 [Anaeromyces robustus]|eukprot:ORX86757.1 hypothetical protein BCR32DRAFT_289821 [Anaeromyces robustus]